MSADNVANADSSRNDGSRVTTGGRVGFWQQHKIVKKDAILQVCKDNCPGVLFPIQRYIDAN